MKDKNLERKNAARVSMRACCNVLEREEEILLRMDIPGVSKDGLSIKINGDKLEIHGTRTIYSPKESNYLVKEIRTADFHQVFIMDDTIDRNKIEAVLKNGVLSLTLNKKESQKPKRIQIKAK